MQKTLLEGTQSGVQDKNHAEESKEKFGVGVSDQRNPQNISEVTMKNTAMVKLENQQRTKLNHWKIY